MTERSAISALPSPSPLSSRRNRQGSQKHSVFLMGNAIWMRNVSCSLLDEHTVALLRYQVTARGEGPCSDQDRPLRGVGEHRLGLQPRGCSSGSSTTTSTDSTADLSTAGMSTQVTEAFYQLLGTKCTNGIWAYSACTAFAACFFIFFW